jgi:hypothetical protein
MSADNEACEKHLKKEDQNGQQKLKTRVGNLEEWEVM